MVRMRYKVFVFVYLSCSKLWFQPLFGATSFRIKSNSIGKALCKPYNKWINETLYLTIRKPTVFQYKSQKVANKIINTVNLS